MLLADPIAVLRAQAGDREALDGLLRDAQRPLHRYLERLLGDPAVADDVLQETLFRIARKLPWLTDPALFRAWAFRIASREAYRHLKRRPSAEPLDDRDAAAGEGELTDDERESLARAVAGLSPASRAVVTLHYLEELPLGEVAEALEIPLGTVKSRLGYGLRQLRVALKVPHES